MIEMAVTVSVKVRMSGSLSHKHKQLKTRLFDFTGCLQYELTS